MLREQLPGGGGRSLTRRPHPPATCAILTGDAGVSRSGYDRGDMANEETVNIVEDPRHLQTLPLPSPTTQLLEPVETLV
jgi:hypothetical protein